MLKVSAALALLALLLLAISLVPWPGAVDVDAEVSEEASSAGAVAEGRALFLAKGCPSCHQHDDAGTEPGFIGIGPDLTNYQPDPEFVRRWLRDPQAVRPTTFMPNLELKEAEIDALIAFLGS